SKVGAPIFSIVVNVARGMQQALAPAVLASIYRDLGSLKKDMIETSRRNRDLIEIHKLNLWSPLFFV
uniref:Aminotransferase-like plant mobile domain-containing protein n=1 Tax=Solanum lycopersicum TaxID=4081 RepID=A0A3Q7GT49_SOLLC